MTPLVTMADPGGAAAEAFRGLRTNLLVAAGDEARAWLITSAAPGESKSEVAGNLAVVCAEAGRRVVLVDADLRTPRQHEMFSLATDTGLSTVLGGALDDLPLQATSVAGLDGLPAGPPAGRPADLVS
ncbi:MAG: capsular biosynthesis protein, partial [Anaerolineae bacterium]